MNGDHIIQNRGDQERDSVDLSIVYAVAIAQPLVPE